MTLQSFKLIESYQIPYTGSVAGLEHFDADPDICIFSSINISRSAPLFCLAFAWKWVNDHRECNYHLASDVFFSFSWWTCWRPITSGFSKWTSTDHAHSGRMLRVSILNARVPTKVVYVPTYCTLESHRPLNSEDWLSRGNLWPFSVEVATI